MAEKEKAKYIFADAIRQIMSYESVEKITVRQITQVSGLSRQTFYRNFYDKYDLINWFFDKLLIKSFDSMGKGKTIYDALVLKFCYIKEQKLFFAVAFNNDDQNNLKKHDFDMIYDFYIKFINEKTNSPIDNEVINLLEMYCQSSIYMTVKWVLNGCTQSPEELAHLMINAIPPKLRNIFKDINLI